MGKQERWGAGGPGENNEVTPPTDGSNTFESTAGLEFNEDDRFKDHRPWEFTVVHVHHPVVAAGAAAETPVLPFASGVAPTRPATELPKKARWRCFLLDLTPLAVSLT